MSAFLIIRPYQDNDYTKYAEIIKDYVMSFASKSFFMCIFKEITIQCIVIVWAILFIFFGVPLTFCALSIPGCVILIFVASYISCFLKAAEFMNEKPKLCWVAESYEPFILRDSPANLSFEVFINESPHDKNQLNKFRRKIVGAISVKNHNVIPNAAFISPLVINPKYSYNKIAPAMINVAAKSCYDNNYRSLELVITEMQDIERDVINNLGFTTRQIYHKQIIGSNLCITKSQLSADLYEWFSSKSE